MYLEQINLDDPKVKTSLRINPLNHCNTWEFYYNQYTVAIDYLLSIANSKRYILNKQFMSFMFVFRHNVELMLKTNLDRNNIDIEETHKISDLAVNLQAYLDSDFIIKLSLLYCEDEGDCFKYIKNKDGRNFFNGEKLKMLELCHYFTELNNTNSNIFFIPFKNKMNLNDKHLDWELTFHTGECRSLGIVCTHYNYTTSLLIKGIIKNELNANEVYLPLLFLIRHGIELSLKNSLLGLGVILTEKEKSKINSTHSIAKLFNLLHSFVDKAIKNIQSDQNKFKDETDAYRQKVESLKDLIHNLDTHSFAFRFPLGNNELKMKENMLFDAYSLYEKSDPYLTYVVDVLAEHGYLELGDDVMSELFE